jgi:predicted nucleic acid-binding Zn ribbon protein
LCHGIKYRNKIRNKYRNKSVTNAKGKAHIINTNMKLLKCNVCNTEISKPRKGKNVCSNKCKQLLYRVNKERKQLKTKQMEQETKQETKDTIYLNFKASEIDDMLTWSVANSYSGDMSVRNDIVPYCFFRKDLQHITSPADVVAYYESKPDEYTTDLFNNQHCEDYKEYQKFKRFFDNECVVFLP